MSESLLELARTAVPSLRDGAISFVRIQTTRPVYLLFGDEDARPAAVAQIGELEPLTTIRDTLRTLHAAVPNLVAASFGCLSWGNAHVHFQEGLAGLPWFRLREEYQGEAAWSRLRQRGLDALAAFHAAVEAVPAWRGRVNLRDDFEGQVREMKAASVVPARLDAWLQSCARSLDAAGELSSHWQHGDYCLNNLLIDPAAVRILDFDEFGETSFPGQDETGLALSLHDLAGDSADWNSIGQQLRVCLEPVFSRQPALRACVQAIVAYYLVRRINRCAGYPSRQAARINLESMLTSLEALPLA